MLLDTLSTLPFGLIPSPLAAAVAGTVIFAAGFSQPETPSIEEERMLSTLTAYLAAIEDGEVDRAMTFLSPDFEIVFEGSENRIPRNAMPQVLAWDVAVEGEVEATGCEILDDRSVGCLLRESNRFFQLLGVEELRSRNRFFFDEEGRLHRQTTRVLKHEPNWQDRLQQATEWLSDRHPEQLNRVMRNGRMTYNGETARTWIRLLRLWRDR